MNKLSFFFFRIVLWLWDIVSLNIVLLFLSLTVDRASVFSDSRYIGYFLVYNTIWMASTFVLALYLSKNWLDVKSFSKQTIKCFSLTVIGLLFFVFITKSEYSRLFLMLSFIGFGSTLLFNRLVFYASVQTLRKSFQIKKNVIILGNNHICAKLLSYFRNESKLVTVIGCFDDLEDNSEQHNPLLKGTLKDALPYAIRHGVTEIYSTLAPEAHSFIYELAKEAEEKFIHFKFVPDYQFFVNRKIYVDFIDDMPILSLRNEPLQDTGAKIKKRLFDVIFSSLVIIFILSWLTPIIALIIRLNSKGPVFFVQDRSGKNNMSFKCLKFRSLRNNDEAHQKQVTADDSRVTSIGRFLRKTNLDELPQFFNVFMGDMSVVGPRPHMLKHTTEFTKIYNEYMVRHFIKPGLTGWAQVHGFRGEIKDHAFLIKRIEYDIWYMENWSVWLDIKIVLMTILRTIQGDKNAY